jgi:trans-2,3-dihydro-3-hydroxyanthranilate isomerase
MRELAETLQLEEKDFDCRYPIQEVSTGLPFIIVPLKTLNAVKRAKVNTSAFLSIAKQVQGEY